MHTFRLRILTPYGQYFDNQVEYLEVRAEHSTLGILPGHHPLISTVMICKIKIKIKGTIFNYSVGGGIIQVEKDVTNLVVNSIESPTEIDIERAKRAYERGTGLLKKGPEGIVVDVARAQAAIQRALNRISLYNEYYDK